jgi:predicted DNA-binding protein
MYQNFKEGEEASKPILIRVPLSTEEKLRNEKRRTGESLSLIVATALEFYFTHRGI